MNYATPFALLSAELSTLPADINETRHLWMERMLINAALPFSVVQGSYKGGRKFAFLVLLPKGYDSLEYRTVMALARLNHQDSILYVSDQGRASLFYCDGRKEYVGVFRAVPAAEAEALGSWTRDTQGNYYVVAP